MRADDSEGKASGTVLSVHPRLVVSRRARATQTATVMHVQKNTRVTVGHCVTTQHRHLPLAMSQHNHKAMTPSALENTAVPKVAS